MILGVVGAAVVGVGVAGFHYATASSSANASGSADDLAMLTLPEGSASAIGPALTVPGGGVAPNLASELSLVRPLISDTSGPLDRGSASLALWASKNLTWASLKALPTTNAALFRKDPEEERGKLLCIEGGIQDIRAEKNLAARLINDHAAPLVEPLTPPGASSASPLNKPDAGDSDQLAALTPTDDAEWQVPGGKVFFAIVTEPDHSKSEEARMKAKPFVVEALAVASTGALVDGDSARFCGILTGVVSMTTASGDTRFVHRAVGMFDLPENTGGGPRPVAAAAPPAAAPAAANSAAAPPADSAH